MIDYIKKRLLIKYPLFGSIVANSNFIAHESVKTAGTDGKNIYYNPDFVKSINNDEQVFLFAHEICHIAFNHIFRSEGKDSKIWNIATDAVINAYLKQEGLPLIEGVVNIPEAINYNAEEMYEKLLKERKQNQTDNSQSNNENTHGNNQSNDSSSNINSNNDGQNQNDNSQSNNGNGQVNNQNSSLSTNNSDENQNQNSHNNSSQEESKNENSEISSNNMQKNDIQNQSNNSSVSSTNDLQEQTKEDNDVGHDTHSMWDKAIEKKHQEEKKSNENEESENQKEIKNEIEKITELGEIEAFKQNKIERQQQLEELRKSLASASHGCGSDTNSNLRMVDNIGIAKPLLNWRLLLKETIKYDVDWSYQNASLEDGVVTPYLEEIPKPETEIVLDTSGSIDETLLRNFLRECKNILQTSKVKVGCFDTKFYGFSEIKSVSDIDNLPFYGGGGTDFDVAVNAFTRRVENKIIFTDGDASMPKKEIDAIWIVFGRKKINPKGGKVIYINEHELEKLHNCYINAKVKRKIR